MASGTNLNHTSEYSAAHHINQPPSIGSPTVASKRRTKESLPKSHSPKCPKLDGSSRADEAASTTSIGFWLAIDFVTRRAGQSDTVALNRLPLLRMDAALGSVTQRRCLRRWSFVIGDATYSSAETEQQIGDARNCEASTSFKAHSLVDADLRYVTYHNKNLRDCMVQLAAFVDDAVERHSANEPISQCSRHDEVVLITSGHFDIRNVFHREIVSQKVPKAVASTPLWWSYIEVERLASTVHSNQIQLSREGDEPEPAFPVIQPLAENAGIPELPVETINKLVLEYLQEGLPLPTPQLISKSYYPTVITADTGVAPESVVEVRHLPWTATPAAIAAFFRGCNIMPGGIAIKVIDGRRSNTGFVCFQTPLDARLACARDQLPISLSPQSSPLPTHLPSSEQSGEIENLGEAGDGVRTTPYSSGPHALLQVLPSTERLFLDHAKCKKIRV
ncbi:unnamed protein product [Dibothriocephalus latus]|uniref:RRM domain-containing protein n=1 Tax=Dibothriocephalus latus TaxID=60516 RepID=A0A3P7LUY0_DIBLA|nr:unnamed protein product [Dibothriocephalus latus]